MKIHFHDLQTQYLTYKDEINHAIQKVLDSSQFIMGPEIAEFEKLLAKYVGCNHVISCASGTDALLLALMAIDLQPTDEVITSPFTFPAPPEVVALLGAKPVFADIDLQTYNIDSNQIAKKITQNTRAIIPVSLYGQPADMNEINLLAKEFGERFGRKIYVIEDAAQSLGAIYQGRKSGNLSDIGCASFFPSKPLGCYGDGGAVFANDAILAEKMRNIRVHGQIKRYEHKYIGFNCRLDTLQAAILQVKLKYFDDELKKRVSVAQFYDDNLKNADIYLPFIKADRTSVYAQYSIRVKNRTDMIHELNAKNIPTAIHYPKPLHLQECFHYLGYQKGDFPVAEKVATEIMSLPMSAFIRCEEQEYVVNSMKKIVEEKKEIFI